MRRDVEGGREKLVGSGGSGRPSSGLPGVPCSGLAGVGLAFIDTVQTRERPGAAFLVGTAGETGGVGLEAVGMLGHGGRVSQDMV